MDKKTLCGQLLGSGIYRDVYVLKPNPDHVIKIERDMTTLAFSNVTEYANYQTHKYWEWLEKYLAPCITISQNGKILIQKKIYHRRRKDYPKQIPSILTDTKLNNYGWINNQFVCCDYASMGIMVGKNKMKIAIWRGSLKNIG